MIVEMAGNLPIDKSAAAIGVARSINKWGVRERARKSFNCSGLTEDCKLILILYSSLS
jgi:hypothetical protein